MSNTPGTTRDYIEENLFLSNKPVKIIDTAGLRETENTIEYEGIKGSYNQIESADAVLYVFDIKDLAENEILRDILKEDRRRASIKRLNAVFPWRRCHAGHLTQMKYISA